MVVRGGGGSGSVITSLFRLFLLLSLCAKLSEAFSSITFPTTVSFSNCRWTRDNLPLTSFTTSLLRNQIKVNLS